MLNEEGEDNNYFILTFNDGRLGFFSFTFSPKPPEIALWPKSIYSPHEPETAHYFFELLYSIK
jgi:hypothetical protein